VDFFFGIFLIAVYDGISQSLAERQRNVELRSLNAQRSFNQSHQAVYQR
jgi:hypothetical protein